MQGDNIVSRGCLKARLIFLVSLVGILFFSGLGWVVLYAMVRVIGFIGMYCVGRVSWRGKLMVDENTYDFSVENRSLVRRCYVMPGLTAIQN